MEEVTMFKFVSNIKSFLKKLLSEPISCNITDYLKEIGFSKETLLDELSDRNIIKKITKIENGVESAKDDKFSVTYQVLGKSFDRKMERFYNDWNRKNKKKMNEATASGAGGSGIGAFGTEGTVGAYEKPLELANEENTPIIRKTKKVYFTQKQLDEATATCTAGNYQYTVPFGAKKGDPTLSREPGFSMKRLK
jgi:hypothetical protein